MLENKQKSLSECPECGGHMMYIDSNEGLYRIGAFRNDVDSYGHVDAICANTGCNAKFSFVAQTGATYARSES